MKTSTTRTAFTIIELIVVCAIIASLAVLLLPRAKRIQTEAKRNQCITNLKGIEIEKDLWEQEQVAKAAKRVKELRAMTDAEAYRGEPPVGDWWKCPAGGLYTVGPIGTKATCSVTGHIL